MAESTDGVKDKIKRFNSFFAGEKDGSNSEANEDQTRYVKTTNVKDGSYSSATGDQTRDVETTNTCISVGEKWIALYDYTTHELDQLSFKKDDVINVTEKYDEWWFGILNDKAGYIPSNYVTQFNASSADEQRCVNLSTATTGNNIDDHGYVPNPGDSGDQSSEDDEQQCTILSTATTLNYKEEEWYSSDKNEWHDQLAAGDPIVVLYDYRSNGEGQLDIQTGQRGIQTKVETDGWSYGWIGGKFGRFPGNYVQICEEETFSERMNIPHQEKVETEISCRLPPPVSPKPKKQESTSETTPMNTLPGLESHSYDVGLEPLVTPIIDSVYQEFKEELRIIMVGKTGSGKSATGNTILCKDVFESKISGQSVTRKCSYGESTANGRNIRVVDTPGLFDTKMSMEDINEEILNCVRVSVPGPHIFLLILQIARFTDEEINTFYRIFEIFGDNMGKFSIILFTKIDDLLNEGKSVKTFIQETGPPLTTFIEKCNGRYFALNNKAPDDAKYVEVQTLMSMMDIAVNKNGNKHFTNEIFQKATANFDRTVKETKQEFFKDNKYSVDLIESHYESKIEMVDKKKASLEKKMSFMEKLKETFQRRLQNPENHPENSRKETDEEAEEKQLQKYNESAAELSDVKRELENLARERDGLIQNKMKRISSVNRKMNDRFLEYITKLRDRYDKEMNEELKAKDEFLAEIRSKKKDEANSNNLALLKKLETKETQLLKDKDKIIKKHNKHFDTMVQKSENLQQRINQDQRRCAVM